MLADEIPFQSVVLRVAYLVVDVCMFFWGEELVNSEFQGIGVWRGLRIGSVL